MDISSENSYSKTNFPSRFDYFSFVHHYTRCHTWSAKMNLSSSRSQKKVPTAIWPCKLYQVCVCTPNPFFLRLVFWPHAVFSLSRQIDFRLLHEPEWPGTRGNERILKFGGGPTSSCEYFCITLPMEYTIHTHLTTLNLPNENLKFYSCKLMFYLSGIEIS